MKVKYEKLKMEVIAFSPEDVVVTSDGRNGQNDVPPGTVTPADSTGG